MTRRAKNPDSFKIVLASSDVHLLRILHREATTSGFVVAGTAREPGSLPGVIQRVSPAVVAVDEPFMSVVAADDGPECGDAKVKPAVVLISDFGSNNVKVPPPPVMGFLGKPPYLPGEFRATAALAVSRQAELEALRAAAREKDRLIEERRTVERAKGLLMQDLRLSEGEAYHRLRKLAMDRRESLFQMANAVLVAYRLKEEETLSRF